MNHDEKKPDLQAWIAPELEARIVAAVLGEASPFEQAEIERLVADNAELAVFKRRIEAVHGLVGLATRPEQGPMRLAPERRAKILETIGSTAERPVEGDRNKLVLLELAAARRRRRVRWIQTYGLAASIALALIVFATLQPSRTLRRMKATEEQSYAQPQLLEMPRAANVEMPAEFEVQAAPPMLEAEEPMGLAKGIEVFDMPKSLTARPNVGASLRQQVAEEARQRGVIGGVRTSPPVFDYYTAPEKKRDAAITAALSAQQNRKSGGGLAAVSMGRVDGALPTELHDFGLAGRTRNEATFDGATAASAPLDSTDSDASGKEWAAAAPELSFSDRPVVLSPFRVEAPQEGGYMASNTLAGTRPRPTFGNLDAGVFKPADIQFPITAVRGASRSPDVSAVVLDDGFLSGSSSAARGTGVPRVEGSVPMPENAAPAARERSDSHLAKMGETPMPPLGPPPPDSPAAEVSAATQPVSTFSLHVSDVSFELAKAALARGERPDPARIRPEEFYNAFDYGDPAAAPSEMIACRIEQSAHPVLQQRNLVRIAMKVPATGRGAGQPLRLTVLLDTSGSMEREDRAASVQAALGVLGSLLGADDRVALIGFARQPRLIVEQLAGDQAGRLAELAAATPLTGGTNMEEALKLAAELARRHRDPGAQNRIVLITDGAANLGNADPAQLATMIETLRQERIAFDACGVGIDGLDDAMLEALTRKGDGRYYVLDRPENANAAFAGQLAGAFRPAAENVKVQVRFNPARVGRYRLIGFEQHRLREEDFRNDQVDAAELAAEEAAVALYQVEVLPDGQGEIGDVAARFRDPASGAMVERSWTILHDPQAPAFDRASPSMQLAGVAALVAEKLRGGAAAELIDLAELEPIVNALRGHYAANARAQELVAMFAQLRNVARASRP